MTFKGRKVGFPSLVSPMENCDELVAINLMTLGRVEGI